MEPVPHNGCEDFLPLRPLRTELDGERGTAGSVIYRETNQNLWLPSRFRNLLDLLWRIYHRALNANLFCKMTILNGFVGICEDDICRRCTWWRCENVPYLPPTCAVKTDTCSIQPAENLRVRIRLYSVEWLDGGQMGAPGGNLLMDCRGGCNVEGARAGVFRDDIP